MQALHETSNEDRRRTATGLSHRLHIFRRRDAAGLGLDLGLGEEAEAGLAPGEVDADVQQGVAAAAGAGEVQHAPHPVVLAGDQGRRAASGVVGGDIHTYDQVARAGRVAQGAVLNADGEMVPERAGDTASAWACGAAGRRPTAPRGSPAPAQATRRESGAAVVLCLTSRPL